MEINHYNPYMGLISGHWYHAIVCGAVFEFWSMTKLSRKAARKAALNFANGDYKPAIYSKLDVESVKRSKPR